MDGRVLRPVVHAVMCAVAALPTAPASAAAPAYVTTVNSLYVYGDVVVVRGGTLTLVNLEDVAHDIVSSDPPGENGPLFQSRLTAGRGDSAVVEGVPALGPGLWPFHCSLHASMRGLIDVRELPA